jgi:uncharacterized protein (DUF342 family)
MSLTFVPKTGVFNSAVAEVWYASKGEQDVCTLTPEQTKLEVIIDERLVVASVASDTNRVTVTLTDRHIARFAWNFTMRDLAGAPVSLKSAYSVVRLQESADSVSALESRASDVESERDELSHSLRKLQAQLTLLQGELDEHTVADADVTRQHEACVVHLTNELTNREQRIEQSGTELQELRSEVERPASSCHSESPRPSELACFSKQQNTE